MLQRTFGFLFGLSLLLPAAAMSADAPVTLEQIMADTDWIGNPPEDGYWGYDSKSVYYSVKRDGSPLKDLYSMDAAGGAAHKLAPAELPDASAPGNAYNQARSFQVFIRDNNVFVRNLLTGSLRQLTQDTSLKNSEAFQADGAHVQWHQGDKIYVYALNSGLLALAADLRLSDDPAKAPGPQNYLQAEQLRLFQALSRAEANKQAAREQKAGDAAADPNHAAEPWYLGDRLKIVQSSLSPNGRWLALVTQEKDAKDGDPGVMPNYVTESGYVETSKEHTYVGLNQPPAQQVKLLDLSSHTAFDLDLTQLPGIKDDPLAALRKTAVEWDVQHGMTRSAAQDSVKAPAVREVSVGGLAWSDDGSNLALQFFSNDNKDRWLASLDFNKKALVTQERLTNPAWVNWTFNDFGWMHDNHSLWYLSEASGYSHLYLKDLGARAARQLTNGKFEINPGITLTHDDAYFYVSANKPAPGTWEIYRVDAKSGAFDAVTNLGGLNGTQPGLEDRDSYVLSPDETKLLVYHSTTIRPPEIYVVDAAPNGAAHQLTHTVSAAFTAVDWTAPQIVQVPSSHVAQPIYARLYLPKDYTPTKIWPAVVFIHGAGYLQDAHSGWSYYFHELMFQTFLNQHGYLVLDMDYRGSAGYGRDWRTAIYRQMGHPEVEDVVDGVHWLEQAWHADGKRLGVYGGSYGGFMTYMMMFRQPDLFAAGAALRPVGDWADYNDGYTSAILNRPNVDPQAYYDSSPINYAGALKHPLIILQGMEDDNVFFMDSVHMVQKLQELRNPNFDVMFYPLEHHSFTDPASWLDEYRRIWRQFNTYVNPQ
ncbi:MAG TPA: prolyl oligopeptidase family serine peptidase [Gammaproteobacteria bacterium]|nr:prolyl oligopeptidase family serine peptidase [Gammaproteobacteria bacterium]